MNKMHYRRPLLMALLSYLAMYVLMYAMVNRFANVYPNLNQAYMAGLMVAPMVVIELALMAAMYPDRRTNAIILAISVAALVVSWTFIRAQTGITDRQFLRSMIPHHAGAILMCQHSAIRDPEIIKLCREIASSQQAEIDQMKGILQRIER